MSDYEFRLDYPLDGIFCFPIYFYFIFVIGSWLFLVISIKLFNVFQSPTDKKIEEYTEKTKKETIELLCKYTPLPVDISKYIVNHFLFNEEQKGFLKRLLNTKLNANHRKTQIFIFCYSMLSGIIHVVCLLLIASINWDWKKRQNISTGKSIQGWIVSVFVAHPLFKLINYAFSIHTLLGDRERIQEKQQNGWWNTYRVKYNKREMDLFKNSNVKSMYITIVAIPYALTFISCILPAIIIYVIPAIFYYFPITVFFSCVAIVVLMIYDYCGVLVDYHTVYKNIRMWILLAVPLYMLLIITLLAMSCVYSNQIRGARRWYLCLSEAFIGPSVYCGGFTVDWTDWRAIVLFLSWILF